MRRPAGLIAPCSARNSWESFRCTGAAKALYSTIAERFDTNLEKGIMWLENEGKQENLTRPGGLMGKDVLFDLNTGEPKTFRGIDPDPDDIQVCVPLCTSFFAFHRQDVV